MSYGERLKQPKLPTLIHVYRKLRGDMIEVYKILNHKYDPKLSNFLPFHKEVLPNSCTKGHSKKLYSTHIDQN